MSTSHDQPRLFPYVVESASRLAARGHYAQFRKRSRRAGPCVTVEEPLADGCIPYVTHLTGVACILARLDVAPVVLAAALLHDYLEDVPDADGRSRIEREVGGEVLVLVLELTEDKRRSRDQAETWELRKHEAIDSIATMSESAVLIKAADVVHNLSTLVYDLQSSQEPDEVWRRFNAEAPRQIWYFEAIHRAVAHRLGEDHTLAREIRGLTRIIVEWAPK